MTLETLRQAECWRLVRAGDGRCAVIEFRGGLVLSLHARERREAPDTPDGVLLVIGEDGWTPLAEAEDRFARLCRGERRLAERLW